VTHRKIERNTYIINDDDYISGDDDYYHDDSNNLYDEADDISINMKNNHPSNIMIDNIRRSSVVNTNSGNTNNNNNNEINKMLKIRYGNKAMEMRKFYEIVQKSLFSASMNNNETSTTNPLQELQTVATAANNAITEEQHEYIKETIRDSIILDDVLNEINDVKVVNKHLSTSSLQSVKDTLPVGYVEFSKRMSIELNRRFSNLSIGHDNDDNSDDDDIDNHSNSNNNNDDYDDDDGEKNPRLTDVDLAILRELSSLISYDENIRISDAVNDYTDYFRGNTSASANNNKNNDDIMIDMTPEDSDCDMIPLSSLSKSFFQILSDDDVLQDTKYAERNNNKNKNNKNNNNNTTDNNNINKNNDYKNDQYQEFDSNMAVAPTKRKILTGKDSKTKKTNSSNNNIDDNNDKSTNITTAVTTIMNIKKKSPIMVKKAIMMIKLKEYDLAPSSYQHDLCVWNNDKISSMSKLVLTLASSSTVDNYHNNNERNNNNNNNDNNYSSYDNNKNNNNNNNGDHIFNFVNPLGRSSLYMSSRSSSLDSKISSVLLADAINNKNSSLLEMNRIYTKHNHGNKGANKSNHQLNPLRYNKNINDDENNNNNNNKKNDNEDNIMISSKTVNFDIESNSDGTSTTNDSAKFSNITSSIEKRGKFSVINTINYAYKNKLFLFYFTRFLIGSNIYPYGPNYLKNFLELILVLLALSDLSLNGLLFIDFFCVSDNITKCSDHTALVLVFYVWPLATIIAPIMGLIAIFLGPSGNLARVYALWTRLAGINNIIMTVFYIQYISYFLKANNFSPWDFISYSIIRAMQTLLVDLYIAHIEKIRYTRGWDGLHTSLYKAKDHKNQA
jgi:hypothetical protein